jgi:hypothetical protein
LHTVWSEQRTSHAERRVSQLAYWLTLAQVAAAALLQASVHRLSMQRAGSAQSLSVPHALSQLVLVSATFGPCDDEQATCVSMSPSSTPRSALPER